MTTFILYLIKVSVSVAAVCLFYFIFLRRLTFYQWNRVYLLGYSTLCFLLPCMDISPVIENVPASAGAVIETIPLISRQNRIVEEYVFNNAPEPFDLWSTIRLVIIVGTIVLSIRLFIQLLAIYKLKQKARVIKQDGYKVYYVDYSIVPFSFGNSIFLGMNQFSENQLQEIILHEYVHIKQKHSIDLLWGEVLCILNWYNPFAWILRYCIKQNLEFIADSQVLEQGINKKDYQYHLLHVVGVPANKIANHFNISSLKNRIIMMNKLQSTKLNLLRFLFLLPLVLLLLTAFRNSTLHSIASSNEKSISTSKGANNDAGAITKAKTNRSILQSNMPTDAIAVDELASVNESATKFSFTIFGVVVDETTKKPIADISITEENTGIGAKTNEKGVYRLVISSTEENIRYKVKMNKTGLPYIASQSGNLFTSKGKPTTGMLMLTTVRLTETGSEKPGLARNLTKYDASLQFANEEIQNFLYNYVRDQANIQAIENDVSLTDSIIVIKDNKSYLYSSDSKVRGILNGTSPKIIIDGKVLTVAQLNAQYKLKDFHIIKLRLSDPSVDKETGNADSGSFEITLNKE